MVNLVVTLEIEVSNVYGRDSHKIIIRALLAILYSSTPNPNEQQ